MIEFELENCYPLRKLLVELKLKIIRFLMALKLRCECEKWEKNVERCKREKNEKKILNKEFEWKMFELDVSETVASFENIHHMLQTGGVRRECVNNANGKSEKCFKYNTLEKYKLY